MEDENGPFWPVIWHASCASVSKRWLFLLEKDATDLRLAAMAIGASTGGGLARLSIRGRNSTAHGVSGIGLSYLALH
ncbi:hypothetical protein SAY86_002431 [Trapa natans]|uniref:Uncharacterized protein n=1 Tax=Trapa natans TaxID=22666 RepID=A0AAN7LFN3_TRANT|nr:hypothetical protein SAY86_002431 [Trapa natans]